MSEKRVSVRLRAEGGGQVRAEFQGVGDTGERAFQRIGREADATGAVIRRLMGIATAFFSARQIVQYADTWTDLQSRVQLAVGSHEAGIAVMGRLSDMARRTYSDLGQTVESWLANATALRELGMSTRESLDFTEALNNALVVSGARAERAAQINNALAQAMALGQLRGQQLNTVIMNGGRVAELLAAELGVNVNQLRALGAQGRITGDVIRRALVGNLELLREEADAMPATIGDAFTLMGNAAQRLVGTWDQLLGASAGLAAGIIFLSDNIEMLASMAIGLAIVMAGRWLISLGALRAMLVAVNATIGVTSALLAGGVVRGLVAAQVATLAWRAALVALRAALILTGIGALVVGAGALVYQFMQLVRGAGGVGEAIRLLGALTGATFRGMGNVLRAWGDGFRAMALDLEAVWTRFIGYLAQKWADFLGMIAPTWNAVMERLGVDLQIDALGAEAYASALEHAAANRAHLAEQMRQREQDGLATAFDETREAWAALMAAMAAADDTADGGLDDALASAEALAAALAAAGNAGRRAGRQSAQGATEAAQGWARVTEIMGKYATEAMDLASNIGGGIVNAFRSAENALGDFVRTGKLDFRSLVRSILADMAQIAARQFIFGPLMRAFSGLLGGLGGKGGLLSGVFTGPKIPSFAGGGYTGRGARTGGLDGMGGFLAMLHPNETVSDHSRGGGGAVTINVNVEGANGDQHVIALVRQGVEAGLEQHDRHVLPGMVKHIIRNPRESG